MNFWMLVLGSKKIHTPLMNFPYSKKLFHKGFPMSSSDCIILALNWIFVKISKDRVMFSFKENAYFLNETIRWKLFYWKWIFDCHSFFEVMSYKFTYFTAIRPTFIHGLSFWALDQLSFSKFDCSLWIPLAHFANQHLCASIQQEQSMKSHTKKNTL